MTKTIKKTKKTQNQKQTADFSQAALLSPERAIGQPEEFMTEDTVLGVGMHLRCSHCNGDLEIFVDISTVITSCTCSVTTGIC